jgi:hypothetical protein
MSVREQIPAFWDALMRRITSLQRSCGELHAMPWSLRGRSFLDVARDMVMVARDALRQVRSTI